MNSWIKWEAGPKIFDISSNKISNLLPEGKGRKLVGFVCAHPAPSQQLSLSRNSIVLKFHSRHHLHKTYFILLIHVMWPCTFLCV